MKTLFDVLHIMVDLFDEHNIPYAIGGSLLLYQKGLDVEVHDIDILLEDISYAFVKNLLKNEQLTEKTFPHPTYPTEHFLELVMDGIEVDLMFSFSIRYQDEVFSFPLEKELLYFQEKPMSFSRIEDWYVMYQLMPKRETKVEMIENYFHKNSPDKFYIDLLLQRKYPDSILQNLRKWL